MDHGKQLGTETTKISARSTHKGVAFKEDRQDSLALASIASPATTEASFCTTASSLTSPLLKNRTQGINTAHSISSTITSLLSAPHVHGTEKFPGSSRSSFGGSGGDDILIPLFQDPPPREELLNILYLALNPTLPVISPEEENLEEGRQGSQEEDEDDLDLPLHASRRVRSASSNARRWFLRCRLIDDTLSSLDANLADARRRSSSGRGNVVVAGQDQSSSWGLGPLHSSSLSSSWSSPFHTTREGAPTWRRESSGAEKMSQADEIDSDSACGREKEERKAAPWRELDREEEHKKEGKAQAMMLATLNEENAMLRYRLAEVEGKLKGSLDNVKCLQKVRVSGGLRTKKSGGPIR